ncbi:helix-turn-helix domain-containing protein [Paenibacillus sabinae]|uniref:Helix-turn-helix domain-containing protein n=1 Tax=Paenibacillus sabinae T27 TaxID=1268072 RepID=X4ZWM2_9BACL|nr:helix-turn-helix transcriptional regulator [Paenibacillus sabinae]AHV96114.1 helix-turn-helix domain-containing protein [Paenibacillus sabinae T27]
MVFLMSHEFKDRLKELRISKGFSQDKLSEELKIPASSIRRYETTGELPKRERLEIIADYFDVSIDYLVGRTNTKNKKYSENVRETIEAYNISNDEVIAKIKIADEIINLPDDKRKIIEDLLKTFKKDI